MTVNRRKKLSRYRGYSTHGCGSKKKGRGAGNRGGRGMAGTGKRAQQKKPGILKENPRYLGKYGFKRPQIYYEKDRIINIKDLPDKEEINLTGLGYTKLLGEGIPKLKYKITVPSCSKLAKEKIEKAGGQIIVK